MLEREMGKVSDDDMKSFGTVDSSEKTVAILEGRWWPQTAKEEGDDTCQGFCVGYGET